MCDPVQTTVQQSILSNQEQVERQNQVKSEKQQPSVNPETASLVRRLLRQKREPNRLGDWVQGDELETADFEEIDLAVAQTERCHYLYRINHDEPKTIEEVFSGKETEKWQEDADKNCLFMETLFEVIEITKVLLRFFNFSIISVPN